MVLAQEQALGSANGSVQELGAKLQSLESEASGSFLGGLGINAAFTAPPIEMPATLGEGSSHDLRVSSLSKRLNAV
jgi:hypothetical protein